MPGARVYRDGRLRRVSASAVLEPARLSVAAGASVSARLRIRNAGAIVDRFVVSAVGPAAGWITADPAESSLFPGQEADVRITFSPPRAAIPRAGTYPFGLRVLPEADPAGSTVEEGRITVEPFVDASADIAPQTSRGSRTGRHDIQVVNRGNAPVDVAVAASDPDRLLTFRVSPETQLVGPGGAGQFSLQASAVETFLRGPHRTIPFAAEVRPGSQAPIVLRGALNQGPRLPGWVVPASGLVVAAAVAVLVLPQVLAFMRPADGGASPTPTTAPTGLPTPTVPVSEAPPSTAVGSPSAQVASTSPIARIRFLDFELDQPTNGVAVEDLSPVFRFRTDGPGTVSFIVNRLEGTGDGNGDGKIDGVKVCLDPERAGAKCKTLTEPGVVTFDNAETGNRAWKATIVNQSASFAPFADVSFEFNALRPAVTLSDVATFLGDANFPTRSFSSFSALVTAREPNQLGVDIAFGDQFPSFGWSLRDTGSLASPPPYTVVSTVNSFSLPVFTMVPPNTYEFRFLGLQAPDQEPQTITYTARFSW